MFDLFSTIFRCVSDSRSTVFDEYTMHFELHFDELYHLVYYFARMITSMSTNLVFMLIEAYPI